MPRIKVTEKATSLDRDLGVRIRARRLQLGMTQEELAVAIGVSFQQIQKYEKAGNRIAVSRLADIAVVLNTTIHDLMTPGVEMSMMTAEIGDKDMFALMDAYRRIQGPENKKRLLSIARTLAL